MLLAGALSGGTDPLQPLARFTAPDASSTRRGAAGVAHGAAFQRIKSSADLDAAIAAAQAEGKTVMLDFYADWCVSCKEMEKYTFPAPAVQAALARARCCCRPTSPPTTTTTRRCMQRFGILGPPSILFFGTDGSERPDYRVVGFKPAEEFAPHVEQALGGPVGMSPRLLTAAIVGASLAGAAAYYLLARPAAMTTTVESTPATAPDPAPAESARPALASTIPRIPARGPATA